MNNDDLKFDRVSEEIGDAIYVSGDVPMKIFMREYGEYFTWSDKKPNEPGLYLWVEKSRSKSSAQTCKIFKDADDELVVNWSGLGGTDWLSDCANRLWLRIPE